MSLQTPRSAQDRLGSDYEHETQSLTADTMWNLLCEGRTSDTSDHIPDNYRISSMCGQQPLCQAEKYIVALQVPPLAPIGVVTWM